MMTPMRYHPVRAGRTNSTGFGFAHVMRNLVHGRFFAYYATRALSPLPGAAATEPDSPVDPTDI